MTHNTNFPERYASFCSTQFLALSIIALHNLYSIKKRKSCMERNHLVTKDGLHKIDIYNFH